MGSCTFCNAPQGQRSTGSVAVLRGLELICKTLDIPLEKKPEFYSFCLNCTLSLRLIYEFHLEIEVLQLKIGDKIKDIHITVLENQNGISATRARRQVASEGSPLTDVFIEKCKIFRKNPVVLLDDIGPKYNIASSRKKWNLRPTRNYMPQLDKDADAEGDPENLDLVQTNLSTKDSEDGQQVHYGVKSEVNEDDQIGEEVDISEPVDRLSDYFYEPLGNVDESETEIQDDDSRINDFIDEENQNCDHRNEAVAFGNTKLRLRSQRINITRRNRQLFKYESKKPYRFNCSHCGRKFINKGSLVCHLKFCHQTSSSPQQTKDCKTCGKVFTARRSLLSHIKTVHEKAIDFVCKYCEEEFRYRSTYKSHLKTVHGAHHNIITDPRNEADREMRDGETNSKSDQEEPDVDPESATGDIANSSRRTDISKITPPHYNKNTIYPFSCPHCDRKFINKGSLAGHINFKHEPDTVGTSSSPRSKPRSSKSKPKCETCGKVFTARKSLLSHVKTVHEKVKAHSCPHCRKEFRYKATYWDHLRIKHADVETAKVRKKPIPAVCHLCGLTLSSQHALLGHMRTHTKEKPFHCDDCEAVFTTKFSLRSHQVGKHGAEGNWSCPHCNKAFSIRKNYDNHLTTHSDVKSYICDRCGKGLKTYSIWKKHLKFHDKLDLKNQSQVESSKSAEAQVMIEAGFQNEVNHDIHDAVDPSIFL